MLKLGNIDIFKYLSNFILNMKYNFKFKFIKGFE